MASKIKTKFVCQECGYETAKWMGRCPDCSAWSSFVEEKDIPKKDAYKGSKTIETAVSLKDIKPLDKERLKTSSKELDRVLGGGVVSGSLILVGGDPGIGKSTLLLQISDKLLSYGKVLYVSGEESVNQIKMRADRLGVSGDELLLLSETSIESVTDAILSVMPKIVIIDSIQTMFSSSVSSAPGSVSQVREATIALMRLAKENRIAIFVVGHVTKDGSLAGPRVLEHMVDCVLYFEGERHQSFRILRAVKNRYGSTNEIGVFEMTDKGLMEVGNPSEMLLSGRPDDTEGSTIICAMEGTRPVLAEIQALVAQGNLANPRRTATGIDYNRFVMLLAVLEKRVGISMATKDAYVNVIGGLRIDETASDLPVIMALASSAKGFPIDSKTVIMGEVGLTGEVRSVSHADQRVSEAKKLGFNKFIMPLSNAEKVRAKDIKIYGVKTVKEAFVAINKINKE